MEGHSQVRLVFQDGESIQVSAWSFARRSRVYKSMIDRDIDWSPETETDGNVEEMTLGFVLSATARDALYESIKSSQVFHRTYNALSTEDTVELARVGDFLDYPRLIEEMVNLLATKSPDDLVDVTRLLPPLVQAQLYNAIREPRLTLHKLEDLITENFACIVLPARMRTTMSTTARCS